MYLKVWMKGDAWAEKLRDGELPTLTKLREMGENIKGVIRSICWIIFPLLVETLKRSFRIVKEVVRR